MTQPSLKRVTLQTLENYRVAAHQAVVAYRRGGHRLVGAVGSTVDAVVVPRAARVAPVAAVRLKSVRGQVTRTLDAGIDQIADGSERVIARGNKLAVAQVGRVAELAAGVDNALVANGLQSVARATLPGAQVALSLSTKVAEGATALAGAVGGRATPAPRAAKAAPATRARKAAAKAPKAAAKAVKTAARKTSRTATKAVKAASAVVAPASPFETTKARRLASKKAAAPAA